MQMDDDKDQSYTIAESIHMHALQVQARAFKSHTIHSLTNLTESIHMHALQVHARVLSHAP